jgi:hypothetical protein
MRKRRNRRPMLRHLSTLIRKMLYLIARSMGKRSSTQALQAHLIGSLETFFPIASEEFSASESSHDLHEHLDPLQPRLPICGQILFDAEPGEKRHCHVGEAGGIHRGLFRFDV